MSKRAGKLSNDGITWLATHREKWLLVYNNADDIKLDIHSWFPPCSHGSILITTRNRQLINHAQGVGAHYQVSGMVPGDGKELLIKTSRAVVSEEAERLAEEITKVRSLHLIKSYTSVDLLDFPNRSWATWRSP